MSQAPTKYQYAVIATDVIIFSVIADQLQVLLIKMKKKPFVDCWAVPGGLVGGAESVDKAAERILSEKTGLKGIYLEQLYTFGRVDRDPFGRVVSVAHFALVPGRSRRLVTTGEYDGIEWFPVQALPKLAYDHREMVQLAVKRLKSRLEYTNIAYSLLPPEFSLSQLQQLYETILGRDIDKRNFRKKIHALNLVVRTGKRELGKQNRPAELYRFVERELKEVEIL